MKKKFKKRKNKIILNSPYRLIEDGKEIGIVKILLLDDEKRVVYLDGSHESISLYELKGKLHKI